MYLRTGLIMLALAAGGWLYVTRSSSPEVATIKPPPSAQLRLEQADLERLVSRYVLDISVHDRRDLEALLDRVEQLQHTRSLPKHGPAFALVLHGPEIDFFAKRNYAENKALVDRVARLDAQGVIETKMCQTTMRIRAIKEDDVPDFIEFVPFGPDEVDRLIRAGRIRM